MSNIILKIKQMSDFASEVEERKNQIIREESLTLGKERERAFRVIYNYLEDLNSSLLKYKNEIKINLKEKDNDSKLLFLNRKEEFPWGIKEFGYSIIRPLTLISDDGKFYNSTALFLIEDWANIKNRIEEKIIEALDKNIEDSSREVLTLATQLERASSVK